MGVLEKGPQRIQVPSGATSVETVRSKRNTGHVHLNANPECKLVTKKSYPEIRLIGAVWRLVEPPQTLAKKKNQNVHILVQKIIVTEAKTLRIFLLFW